MKRLSILVTLLLLMISSASADSNLPGVNDFIAEMVTKHHFDKNELTTLFAQVQVNDSILKAIARPAEKSKPWYDYRKIFITDKRINGGVLFWKKHQKILAEAEKQYGVPAEIIIAILGVETRYGGNVGSYRVIDSLSTLAFRYPPRSKFFRRELENFLILTHEENLSALKPVGSYAGAMGLGQFMPSSYLSYAVDFDHDGHRDIWTNPVDAIGSIANYLNRHGWIADESIVHKTTIMGQDPIVLVEKGYKPTLTRDNLRAAGVSLTYLPPDNDKIALISLTQEKGEEYWIARQNFYVITRYNHSRMYAMAVNQLANKIREQYEQVTK